MITIGYKGRSTPQLSSWARFGHTTIATDFTITRRYHSDSFSLWRSDGRDRIHNNPKVSICPQCIIHEPKESSAMTGFQARLTTYTNFCILPSCLKKPSSGSNRLSTMSGRFRRMLDALQDTFYTSSSRGWNPRTGSRWQALAREFMKFVFIRVLNIVSFTSRSSAREFTCFTPFRRKHDRPRRVISIWQGDD